MPGFDRTGPQGAGPMTGGGRGRCNSANATRATTMPGGFGFGGGGFFARGFRRGRGCGYGRGFGGYGAPGRFNFPWEPVNEIDGLKGEADRLKNALDAVKRRIQAIEKNVAESE
jgi:hypothetical protein